MSPRYVAEESIGEGCSNEFMATDTTKMLLGSGADKVV